MSHPTRTSFTASRLAIASVAALVLLASPAQRTAAASGRTAHAAVGPEDEQNRTQTDRETKVLTVGANGTLELKNISGDIHVTGGTGREIRVEITRTSRGRTDDDVRLGLQRVTVKVEQQGDRATVAVEYPREERRNGYSVDVAYTVTAPAGLRIDANSVSGNVRVENMKSDVAAHSISGNVVVSGAAGVTEVRSISGNVTLTGASGDSATLGTVSGNVTIDRVAARQLHAETTSGEVRATGVDSDRASMRSLSGSVVYAGAVAKAGRYELQTHSGNVSFTPVGAAGYALDAATFSGTIIPPPGMAAERLSGRGARQFHGTIGSGGASVSITTFSGDITVGAR